MARKAAYRFMQQIMDMTPAEAHIGNFDVGQCQELIRRLKEYSAER